MVLSGGCIGQREILTELKFEIPAEEEKKKKRWKLNKKQPQEQPRSPVGLTSTPRRSDYLHDKTALLYNGNKTRNPLLRPRSRRPDVDDDWGLPHTQSRRDSSTSPAKDYGQTTLNESTNAAHSPIDDAPHPLSPTQRFRNVQNRKTTRSRPEVEESHQKNRSYMHTKVHSPIEQIGIYNHSPLFESARENVPVVGRKSAEETSLFEHSRHEYDIRDQRRVQAIAETVHTMETSNRRRSDNEEVPRQLKSEEKPRLSWSHRPERKFDVEVEGSFDESQDKYSLDEDQYLAPTVKADTRMGIIVSDLSNGTIDHPMRVGPVDRQTREGPVERATMRIQNSLIDSKVSESFDSVEEENAITYPAFSKAHLEQYERPIETREPPAAESIIRRGMREVTPKHSNTKRDIRKMHQQPKEILYPPQPLFRHQRQPRSPVYAKESRKEDAMYSLKEKQSRKIENNKSHGRYSVGGVPTLQGKDPKLEEIPFQRSKSHDSSAGRRLLLRKSRSSTPTNERRLEKPKATPQVSSESESTKTKRSQIWNALTRPLTPNRLRKARGNLNESIQLMDLVAEQKLKEIQARRNQKNTTTTNPQKEEHHKLMPRRKEQDVQITREHTRAGGAIPVTKHPQDSQGGSVFWSTAQGHTAGDDFEKDTVDQIIQGAEDTVLSDSNECQSRSRTRPNIPEIEGSGRRLSEVRKTDPMQSTHRRRKGLAGRFSSMISNSFDSSSTERNRLHETTSHETQISEKLKRDMMHFDSLMEAIETDKQNSLGAEFAVVELGDEDNAVQTHAILMNRDDVEDQLMLHHQAQERPRSRLRARRW